MHATTKKYPMAKCANTDCTGWPSAQQPTSPTIYLRNWPLVIPQYRPLKNTALELYKIH